jgi:2'-5' RNA ligase
MTRVFVAIALPPHTVDALSALCEGIPGARWVNGRFHLTLRFVGEVDRAAFDEIVHALGEVDAHAFELALAGVGHFPPRGAPRALWAGVRRDPALELLQSRIESALQRADLPPETRKFAAHITLARLRDAPIERVQAYLARHALFAAEPFPVEAFHLFSSQMTRDGSIYAIEASYPLRGGYEFDEAWEEETDGERAARRSAE